MLGILVKSALIIGSCSSLAIISTLWSKPEGRETDEKINFKKHKKKTINQIKRVEDIDVWGQENGCAFVFVKDFNQDKIYSALEYSHKNSADSNAHKKLEETMVEAAEKHKRYCGDKLKTFTFLWSSTEAKFYIGDPKKHSERELNALNRLLNNNWDSRSLVIR